MKKLLTIFILLTTFTKYGTCQNLVPNGSFEQHTSCPDNTSEVDSVIGWRQILNTPDYYNTCATVNYVSVPDNVCGSQMPFEGNAYIGLYSYNWNSFYREIVGTQLIDTLIIGNTYHASFRLSKGNHTPQANNNAASNKLG